MGWKLLFIVMLLALFASCSSAPKDRWSPLWIERSADTTRASLYGTVHRQSFDVVIDFLDQNSDITTLVFVDMAGSADDDTNLRIAREIRRRKLNTTTLASTKIESGAVDLFLAGVERTAACGAEFGVHSWYDSAGYGPRDIVRDSSHPDHAMFISYYEEMGIDEALYWFTVDAAPPEDILVMSWLDLNKYNVVTTPIDCSTR
ncbi:MAG: alpha/beta hydrolase [Henriciella sp.]|jgi:hypothetical protein